MKSFSYIIVFLIASKVYSQDVHFSQFINTPLTYNPALTGGSEGKSRATMHYRSQWLGVGQPYTTGYGAFETYILKEQTGNNDLTVGVVGLFDKTAGGGLASNYATLSLGYHLKLDEDEINTLSLGFQSTYVSKHLDYANLSFADQFSSGGFNLNLPSNQTFNQGSIGYLDFNTGLAFNRSTDNSSVEVGTSLYHITRPRESFLASTGTKIDTRINLHVGGYFYTGNDDRIYFNGLMMHQGNSNQYIIGGKYEKYLQPNENEFAIGLGAYYRVNESIIPILSIKFNKFNLGLSYDVVSSKLNIANATTHSIELGLSYLIL